MNKAEIAACASIAIRVLIKKATPKGGQWRDMPL